MKVMYLTWGETPRSYGVFGSQVLAQFAETAKLLPASQFSFLAAVPVVNSSLVREFLSYSKELAKIRLRLDKINFSRIPIYAPQPFVNANKSNFRFMHGFAHWHLSRKITAFNPSLIHCRSYHAAWAALKVREKHGFDYKIVFDGRGLWPEEIALKKGASETSDNYLFLKELEREILAKADVSIAVSDPMFEHYQKLNAKKLELIYLSASVAKLRPSQSNAVERTTPRRGGPVTLCYLGALSGETWHQPQQLLELYQHVRSVVSSARLIIVSTSDHQTIRRALKDIPENELFLTSTKTIEELSHILSDVDFGVLPYRDIENFAEHLVGKTLLGTKTAEYMAAGLPIIVNENCGGAAAIVEKTSSGIAYDPATFKQITSEVIDSYLQAGVSTRLSDLATPLFDYKSNAQRYAAIYRTLLS